ncbi:MULTISPECIES: beta-glucoside-specific PTS transporter subunit IIABC [Bacillota]|uniref:PTS glucose transporter subunit IIA n=2 Tax=Amedibacillus TaxID=2749846 RepID=A0A7G9GK02_9FIRM|nr:MULTISPECIES: beta-glucoside-specific PTS transporter subunit IIABC [Bacillota]QNM11134.1 PTS glucose transporter subunit IIA [[Eubacterium] hominis]MCH4284815.1 beta-glucoside-specific PTS transporter subunit IIABC [Amedibacillus hominis]RGB52655.1 PTS beta-glucoside transporter subunit EIIBCA [Absiella sp. AM22-9]RGB57124.1 PTS beta-glucoside transporter subunit EIIBCA [Absiella sp. AM10-20]RGB68195.1 PTS beta-glucoside transporter subunit EIIBCA [Absiella sp. AM09-45]
MNIKQTAGMIVKAVGGKSNIKEMFHCVTRLRFYLKDESVVNLEEIKKIDGVLGAQYQTEQLQIIIGNDVEIVYDEIIKQIGFIHNEETLQTKQKFQLKGIFETMAAIFLPVVPVLAGTGMVKGLITILTSFCGVDPASEMITVLTIVGDCVFYFFPFLVAWSASKRFKTDTACAMALAGALLYPTMTAGLAQGLDPLHFLGMPIPFVKYAASSIPIILSVWVMSYVYKYVDKFVPKFLRLVFTPMIVLLIMVPITLIATGPLASYLAKGLAQIVKFLFDLSPIIAGAVVGGTRLLVVLTGMHLSLGAICMENLSQFGYDVLLPINTMGTMALVGVTLGVWFKSKRNDTKSVAMSSFISAFIGITEPGIYGVLLKFKNALLSVMLAGAVGGAFVAFFGGHATAYVNSCILSLPVFMGDGFWAVCTGMGISTVLGFIFVQIFGLSEEKNLKDKTVETKIEEEHAKTVFISPMSGDLVKLDSIDDPAFSSGSIGKGIAINPNNGKVVAPVDGTIKTIFPTKHAIGIESEDGIECLIHIGMDTVNLQGKYFNVIVKEGQQVKQGELIAEVDLASILKEGYSLITPVIVTNADQYLDVLPFETQGIIVSSEPLLTVLK